MRDHEPQTLDDFKGLWKRGDRDSVPMDHFSDCNNIKYNESSFLSRDGVGPDDNRYRNIVRGYPFRQSELVMDIDGNIYHTDRPNATVPILTVAGMTDFSFAQSNNRAFISPIGPTNSFVYVYTYGDTAGARKAAGQPLSSAPTPTASAGGNCEQGVHIIAIVCETDTGFQTQLSPGASIQLNDGTQSINVAVPIHPDSFIRKRHVVATKAIDPADWTGDLKNYQFFFVPDGTINDNSSGSINVNFYDAELLEDASYLDDLLTEIPNCGALNTYHNRLMAMSFPQGNGGEKIANLYVSFPGEPEAFDQVDGLIELSRDGRPITYGQEQRDIFYLFKSTKTIALTDNGDIPASWPKITIDQGIGANGRAIGVVMDSGGVNIDWLLVGDYTGLLLFNGTYQLPELTWKIRDLWPTDRASFTALQVVVDSQNHIIYVVKPDGQLLVGDYNNGLNWENIKWTPWSLYFKVSTLFIIEEGGLRTVIGTKEAA